MRRGGGVQQQHPRSETRPGALDDGPIADAIAQGDEAALAHAYAQHSSRVHALVCCLCGSRRADDVTQEVFLELWNDPGRYDPGSGSLRSHLLVRAHARAVAIRRRDSAQGSMAPLEPVDPAVEAAALALLADTGVDELVAALPESERHPIVLAYFGGHTYADVARLLRLPERAVKQRIRTGLDRLGAERTALIDLTEPAS